MVPHCIRPRRPKPSRKWVYALKPFDSRHKSRPIEESYEPLRMEALSSAVHRRGGARARFTACCRALCRRAFIAVTHLRYAVTAVKSMERSGLGEPF